LHEIEESECHTEARHLVDPIFTVGEWSNAPKSAPMSVTLWVPVAATNPGWMRATLGARYVKALWKVACTAWFRAQGPGFRVQGSGFRVQGLGSRVQGVQATSERGSGARTSIAMLFTPMPPRVRAVTEVSDTHSKSSVDVAPMAMVQEGSNTPKLVPVT